MENEAGECHSCELKPTALKGKKIAIAIVALLICFFAAMAFARERYDQRPRMATFMGFTNTGPDQITAITSLLHLKNLVTDSDTALRKHDLDGKPFKLSDFKGKFVLLEFWAVGAHRAKPRFRISRKFSTLSNPMTASW